METSSRLRRARLAAGLSVAELARAAECTENYVRQLERLDRKEPGVRIAQRLANALGVRLPDLWPPHEGRGGEKSAARTAG